MFKLTFQIFKAIKQKLTSSYALQVLYLIIIYFRLDDLKLNKWLDKKLESLKSSLKLNMSHRFDNSNI